MHFRSKSGHLNETVYCKPIDRRLKTLLNEGLGSLLRPTLPDIWKTEMQEHFEKFFIKKQVSKISKKCQKIQLQIQCL